MKAFPDAQISYDDYMRVVHEFVQAETDEVLEAGLKDCPWRVTSYATMNCWIN
jgi:hypothetical protein